MGETLDQTITPSNKLLARPLTLTLSPMKERESEEVDIHVRRTDTL
jgi:hypothetical protein